MEASNLIIIASQPRSGSTLLQALLSNNKEVATISEPWFLLPFLSYLKPEVSNGVYNSSWALSAINEFKNKSKSFDSNLSNFLINQYSNAIPNNEIYILDKTPRYYEILSEIQECFPEAKFIILKRNPLAVLSSILNTWTLKKGAKLRMYSRDLLQAPHLLLKFEKENKNNKNVKSLKYEDLAKNPDEILKDLYCWLKIPFDSNVLDYSKMKNSKGEWVIQLV
ncbi:sulfotransferase family protein [Formosa algae]|uniref:sulfotransferase family protein n=1 Tax=Formosa algae TaxID=225843 RepID=UPI000CCE2698|nr:sulfotransferase [Formosa algae]PNW26864.1 hypothetical protein BKP44_15400 [Formosa algae]